MSATKVIKIANRIEKLRNKKIVEDEKHKKSLLYYDEQIQKTKEKFEKELAYWSEARTKSVISNLKYENEIIDKHIALLKELDKVTQDAEGVEALKEVVDRVKGYKYKDRTHLLELLKE